MFKMWGPSSPWAPAPTFPAAASGDLLPGWGEWVWTGTWTCVVFCPPSGHLLSQVTDRGTAAKRPSSTGGRGRQTCPPQATPLAPPPAPGRPPHKVKTVFQLLREKRLREARASKAAQAPVVLPPQLLVSSPVILQPPLTLASCGPAATGPGVSKPALSGPGAPAAASSSAPGSGVVTVTTRPLALQALAWAPVPTVALQVPGSHQLDGHRQSPAAAPGGQGLPEAPALLPSASNPTQPLVQPLGLTPGPGTHRDGPHAAASNPLPVSSVLTAAGLLPVPLPAVVGLPGPAAAPDPQGLAVTLLPSLTETPVGQGPANRDAEPGPASRADLESLSPSLPPQIPAEVCGHTAQPHQLPLPPSAGPGRTLLSPAEPEGTRAPLGLERPPPPPRGPEKDALDLSLLSQESEPAVQEWLRGQRGVCVPPLGTRLPYQPPTLCSLRALSGLLLHKKTLEHRAAALVPGGAAGTLQASRGWVREQLQDSPAYLLLKARFLAAFTLPALLATLPPPGVRTTLSAVTPTSGSEDEDLEELAHSDGSRQPGQASGSTQAGSAATPPVQVGDHGHSAVPPHCPARPCGLPRVVGRAAAGGRGQESGWCGGVVAACRLQRRLPLGRCGCERKEPPLTRGALGPHPPALGSTPPPTPVHLAFQVALHRTLGLSELQVGLGSLFPTRNLVETLGGATQESPATSPQTLCPLGVCWVLSALGARGCWACG